MTTPKRPDPPKKDRSGLSDKSANIIVATVATLWAVSMGASIVTGVFPQLPDYQPPEYIHGAFLAIVGGAFVLRGKGKDD